MRKNVKKCFKLVSVLLSAVLIVGVLDSTLAFADSFGLAVEEAPGGAFEEEPGLTPESPFSERGATKGGFIVRGGGSDIELPTEEFVEESLLEESGGFLLEEDGESEIGTLPVEVPTGAVSTIVVPGVEEKPGHVHQWTYGTISSDSNGEVVGLVCSCGASKGATTITSYAPQLNKLYELIKNAASGSTVVLDMKDLCTFPQALMLNIANRPDCNFIIKYSYDNVSYTLSLPAGVAIDVSALYYGPAEMARLYFPYLTIN